MRVVTLGVWESERVGFEPTCPLRDKTLSRRPRYDHFGTSPSEVVPLGRLETADADPAGLKARTTSAADLRAKRTFNYSPPQKCRCPQEQVSCSNSCLMPNPKILRSQDPSAPLRRTRRDRRELADRAEMVAEMHDAADH